MKQSPGKPGKKDGEKFAGAVGGKVHTFFFSLFSPHFSKSALERGNRRRRHAFHSREGKSWVAVVVIVVVRLLLLLLLLQLLKASCSAAQLEREIAS